VHATLRTYILSPPSNHTLLYAAGTSAHVRSLNSLALENFCLKLKLLLDRQPDHVRAIAQVAITCIGIGKVPNCNYNMGDMCAHHIIDLFTSSPETTAPIRIAVGSVLFSFFLKNNI